MNKVYRFITRFGAIERTFQSEAEVTEALKQYIRDGVKVFEVVVVE